MNRMLPGRNHRGLTLIELMITLVVLSIVLLVGAPPMRRLLHGNQLRAEAGRLLTAINLARSEAIARNLPVSLCPSAMAVTGSPDCSGEYAGGWIVFANRDRDKVVDEGTDQVIRAFAPIPAGYTLTNRSGTLAAGDMITYLPDGSSRRNLTLLVCASDRRSLDAWSIVLNMAGRARVAQGEGKCPAAST